MAGLSDRVRAGSEAAPWVVDEIRKLEQMCDELLGALIYHQEQTRPIQRSIDAIAKTQAAT